MWDWLDFVVVVFAASGLVDLWRNGSIFADWRAFFENDDTPVHNPTLGDPENAVGEPGFVYRDTSPEPAVATQRLPWLMRLADRCLPRWVGGLLSCSYCLSYHVPWIVSMVLIFPATVVPWPWLAFLLRIPAYSLAATRIGNLINTLIPDYARYDRFK